MALPKLQTTEYKLTLPSTQEEIKFRPFLVKEQKILMIAQESGDENQIGAAVGQLVSGCTFGSVDANVNPMFDIEYVFLQLRAKSVGSKLSDFEKTLILIVECVDKITSGGETIDRIDMTKDEIVEFIDSMNANQLESVLKFYESMPKVRHIIDVVNPKTKKKGEVLVEGIENFLE